MTMGKVFQTRKVNMPKGRKTVTEIPLNETYFLTHDTLCWTLWERKQTDKGTIRSVATGYHPTLEFALRELFQTFINSSIVESVAELLQTVMHAREAVEIAAKNLQANLDQLAKPDEVVEEEIEPEDDMLLESYEEEP